MSGLSLENRRAVIIHKDLISFLNESRFDILHAYRTNSRVELLRKIESGRATKEEIRHQKEFKRLVTYFNNVVIEL